MKIFLKILSKKSNLLLIAVFLFAALIRFYNFSNRVSFSSEQARSLIVSSEYLKNPSLLGQDYFIGHDSNGHVLYAGALFNYLLVPPLLVTKDVVPITVLFAILNIATGFVVYWAAKKMFNEGVGILSATFFLFSDYMIYHSLFIWIYNPLPLIGILTVYFLYLYTKKQKIGYVFALGFLSGIGISLQYLYAPLAAIVLGLIIWGSKKKIWPTLSFIIAGVLANLPMVIFDLRHNFYNFQTIIRMFLDALAGKGNAQTNYLVYYHFFPFWPLFAIAGGWILMKVYKVNKLLAIILILLYVFLNLTSSKINFNGPTSTPGGLYVSQIDEASQKIALDAKDPFNVVEVLDFDKQAYMLRYFVGFKYGNKPLGVEDYPNAKLLYILAPKNYNFAQSDVWEIYSGGPFKVELFYSINNSYGIYKLTRNNSVVK
jgi:4-amino-4-deoxy-L-arabinose transferase-like glycosyltransferase